MNCSAPINKLSDHLLIRIISFLPTKFAVRTSVLSQKWKDLWRWNSSFCIMYSGKDTWAGGITKTLRGLTTPKLSTFHLIVDDVPDRPNDVDDWVYHIRDLEVNNITIRFIGGDHNHRFCDRFYVNDCLKRLTLQMEHPDMLPRTEWLVSWPSLTRLSLCCPHLPQEVLDNLLARCPLLRSLTLYECEKQLMYFNIRNAPTVKSLDLHCFYNQSEPEMVKIDAPSIRYLRLYIASPCMLLDVQYLEEARLNCCLTSSLTKDSLQNMMEKLQNVKKFTFGSNLLMLLSLAQVHNIPSPTFKVLEDLRLESTILRSVLPGIRRILQNSPALKRLTIDLVKLIEGEADHAYLSSQGLHLDQMWESNEGDYFFVGEDCKTKLVRSVIRFLLGNKPTLETLVVRLGGYIAESKFQELERTTPHKIGDVTVVLKRSFVRSFTSIFECQACPEHRTIPSMMI